VDVERVFFGSLSCTAQCPDDVRRLEDILVAGIAGSQWTVELEDDIRSVATSRDVGDIVVAASVIVRGIFADCIGARSDTRRVLGAKEVVVRAYAGLIRFDPPNDSIGSQHVSIRRPTESAPSDGFADDAGLQRRGIVIPVDLKVLVSIRQQGCEIVFPRRQRLSIGVRQQSKE